MTLSTPCPGLHHLQRFVLGQDDDAAADAIASHLAGCPGCVAVLAQLDAHDELTAAAAQRTPLPAGGFPAHLEGLIERLKALRGPTLAAAPIDTSNHLLAPPEAADEMGRLGHYRVLKVLGAGGMGIVYLAEDIQLQRRVALKVLRPTLAGILPMRQRFLHEARAAALVSTAASEYLVPIYEVGMDRDLPYLTMPLLEGETLAERLAREGRLPMAEICRIGREVARGLAVAHRHGLVHRDVKPANIWLESGSANDPEHPAGRVKLLDFGLVQTTVNHHNLTELGTLIGTPEYMAPEQARGERVDARCDLFSLGSVLYAMAAGYPPFQGKNSLAVLRSVCNDTPPPLGPRAPELPAGLVALIESLHAREPAERCSSAQEVATRLEAMERGNGMARPSRSRRVRLAVAAAAGILLLAGVTAAALAPGWQGPLEAPPNDPPTLVAQAGDERPEPAQAAPGDNEVPADKALPMQAPVAVLPFDERGPGVKDLGAQVSDLLTARLAMKEDLVLVDRADLTRAMGELQLGLSGAVKPESAPRVGQLTGARLLLFGTIMQADKKRYLIGKLVGVETSRVVVLSVEAPASGELAALVSQLATKVADKLAHPPEGLLARAEKPADRVAELKQKLGQQKRPVLWVQVREHATVRPAPDPAAQTELIHVAQAVGFEVVDAEEGARGQAQVLLTGEGVSEVGPRHGELITVKARVEVKAVDRLTGKVLAVDRQTALVVDVTEQLAGKAALQQAADTIAQRILPRLVKR